MRDESKSITDVIHDSKGWFVHLHVIYPNVHGPGMGEVNDESNIRTLREVMNDGFLSVEVFDDSFGPQHTLREHALSRMERGHSCPQLQHSAREHALSQRSDGTRLAPKSQPKGR